jgi:hypothetical protein
MSFLPRLPDAEVGPFSTDPKIGLLATLDPGGLPHVTLITTLEAASAERLTWGQFCEGASKDNVRRDPRVGFLVMTLARDLWRGRAVWVRASREGPEFEAYNRKPLFRYNSYFGIHTVHFMDVERVTPRGRLPVPRMVAAGLAARVAAVVCGRRRADPALKPWAAGLLRRVDSLKFLCFVDGDGYPVILPAVGCAPADASRVVIVPASSEAAAIPPGAHVAVFALSLKLESVLLRGRAHAIRPAAGAGVGAVDVDWVYNSMPPKQGQVHPMPALDPVTRF